jgi:nucleoside phosphorylase
LLNILVVDDEPKRFAFFEKDVFNVLANENQVSFVSNVRDAISQLENNRYDVLIVDMAVLSTPWATEPDPEGGVRLLQHLQEDDTLKRPSYIIGLTAAAEDDGLSSTAFFNSSPWVLLRIGDSGTDWEARLIGLLNHALAVKNAESAVDYNIDVCLITALAEPEQSALMSSGFEIEADPEYLDSCTTFRRGRLACSDGRYLSVIFGCSLRMGSVESGLLAQKLITRFRPKLLLMAGICAGLKDKTEFGDPILATTVWDWTSSKWTVDDDGVEKILPAPHYIPCAREISSRFDNIKRDDSLLTGIRSRWVGPKPNTVLTAHAGPVASGPIVVADGTTLEKIKNEQTREVMGLEMEAYGIYAAAETAGLPRPWVASIKSVCDFADPRKNDAMQKYAAYTSAAVVREFLFRYGKELCALVRK